MLRRPAADAKASDPSRAMVAFLDERKLLWTDEDEP